MSQFDEDDDPKGVADDALEHEAEASLDDTYEVLCPHCAGDNVLVVDLGGGERQSYVEDCQVCCRPWQVHVDIDPSGRVRIRLEGQDE